MRNAFSRFARRPGRHSMRKAILSVMILALTGLSCNFVTNSPVLLPEPTPSPAAPSEDTQSILERLGGTPCRDSVFTCVKHRRSAGPFQSRRSHDGCGLRGAAGQRRAQGHVRHRHRRTGLSRTPSTQIPTQGHLTLPSPKTSILSSLTSAAWANPAGCSACRRLRSTTRLIGTQVRRPRMQP